MKIILGIILGLASKLKAMTDAGDRQLDNLFNDLTILENEIDILETKLSTQDQLNQLKFYKKEWRYFNNNIETFLNIKLEEEYTNLYTISGLPSKHEGLDIYSNKYFFLTKEDKVLLIDFSGAILLEQELDFKARFFSIYQDHVRRFPQVKSSFIK